MAETISPNVRWTGVCLDCADAEQLATFYGRLLGWEVTARDDQDGRLGGAGWIAMNDPAGGVGLLFQAEEWYEPPVWPDHFLMSDGIDTASANVASARYRPLSRNAGIPNSRPATPATTPATGSVARSFQPWWTMRIALV